MIRQSIPHSLFREFEPLWRFVSKKTGGVSPLTIFLMGTPAIKKVSLEDRNAKHSLNVYFLIHLIFDKFFRIL